MEAPAPPVSSPVWPARAGPARDRRLLLHRLLRRAGPIRGRPRGLQVNGWLNCSTSPSAGSVCSWRASPRAGTRWRSGASTSSLAIIGWGSEWLNVLIGVLGLAGPGRKPGGTPCQSRERSPFVSALSPLWLCCGCGGAAPTGPGRRSRPRRRRRRRPAAPSCAGRAARSARLGELLGPVGELLGGSLGDGGEGVLDPGREALRRLDRPQRVAQQRLDVPVAGQSSLGSVIFHFLLQLFDRAVDQHLGRAVRAPQRPRDLAVVHAQGEAHDQRLAPVVGQPSRC